MDLILLLILLGGMVLTYCQWLAAARLGRVVELLSKMEKRGREA